ncbi:hypothetical protein FTV95_01730 [Escherichia coli]|nr:hypothetical protein FTV95_01730 [Escherichia coli]
MFGGVKIAEAFPEGRGSPHGCGLRARFTGMLPRARPGSRKGISRGHRAAAILFARARGCRGRRRLVAPCALLAPVII